MVVFVVSGLILTGSVISYFSYNVLHGESRHGDARHPVAIRLVKSQKPVF